MSLTIAFLTVMFVYFTSLIDFKHISEGQYFTDHTDRFLQRLCFFLSVSVYNWQIGIASALLFSVLFDSFLNILTGSPLFYLGNTAKWDRFFRKRMWLYLPLKFLMFITSVLLFIYG